MMALLLRPTKLASTAYARLRDWRPNSSARPVGRRRSLIKGAVRQGREPDLELPLRWNFSTAKGHNCIATTCGQIR